MYFDANLLGIHQNGRFAKCWLAATNQKAFRAYFKREDVEDVQITNLCDEILKSYKSKSLNPKKNLSLLTIAQLLFGTVSIYQQQVQFLYDKTKNLFALKNYYNSTSLKRNSHSNFFIENDNRYGKNVCLNLKNNELLKETEDTNSIIISAAEINNSFRIPPTEQNISSMNIPTQIGGNQQIIDTNMTIKDIDWNKKLEFGNDDELFDELTNEDAQHFIDIISGKKTLFDICNNKNLSGNKNKSTQNNISKILAKNKPKSANNDSLNENGNTSIDILRAANHSMSVDQNLLKSIPNEIDISTNNFDNIIMTIESLPHNDIYLNEPTLNDIPQINEISLPPIITTTGVDLSSIELNINQPEKHNNYDQIQTQQGTKRNLENLPSDEIQDGLSTSKRRKKSNKLKIDVFTELNSETIKKQITNFKNLRCLNPIDDAITFYEYNLKNAQTLFSNPCIKFNNSAIHKIYKRNIKTKRTKNDKSIINEILDQQIDENLEINTENIEEPPKKKKKKNPNINKLQEGLIIENQQETIEQQFEQQNENYRIIIEENPVENENFLISNPNVELILKNVYEDFIKNNRNLYNSHPEDTEAGLLLKNRIYSEWNNEAIIRKLLNLWKKGINPIDMNLLCKNAKKREAAVAFSSILELSAYRYIKIIKNDNTNLIKHLEIGEKILEKLKINNSKSL